MSCNTVVLTAFNIIFPYMRASQHIGNAIYLISNRDTRGKGIIKTTCVVAVACIGIGVSVGLSPQMFDAFYKVNRDVDQKTCLTECQTELGLKIGTGVLVTLVDVWAFSFCTMVGGEIGDGINFGTNWVYQGAKKVSDCVSRCFRREARYVIEPEIQV